MNELRRHNIYGDALEKWGRESQLNMCIEECAELIQAIQKIRRNPNTENIRNLCEEIADVEIMIEQMRMITMKEGVIDNFKEEKLQLLEKLLSHGE